MVPRVKLYAKGIKKRSDMEFNRFDNEFYDEKI